MSRVTIGTLVDDFIDSPFEERAKTRDIEVVPRKIVEKVRKECESWVSDIEKNFNVQPDRPHDIGDYHAEGRKDALEWVIKQIDTELAEFEEGVEE